MKTKFLFITIIAACLLTSTAFAQSIERNVAGSAGASGTGAGISVDYTIGEVLVQTLTGSGNILTQGFHQPATTQVSIEEVTEVINSRVFPNPFTDEVQLEFSTSNPVSVQLRLTDIAGRIITETKPVDYSEGSHIQTLNTERFASGSYLLVATMTEQGKIPVSVSKKIQLIR